MIHADHREMVRFKSREDDGYEKVSTSIKFMVEKARDGIQTKSEEVEVIKNGIVFSGPQWKWLITKSLQRTATQKLILLKFH